MKKRKKEAKLKTNIKNKPESKINFFNWLKEGYLWLILAFIIFFAIDYYFSIRIYFNETDTFNVFLTHTLASIIVIIIIGYILYTLQYNKKLLEKLGIYDLADPRYNKEKMKLSFWISIVSLILLIICFLLSYKFSDDSVTYTVLMTIGSLFSLIFFISLFIAIYIKIKLKKGF